MNNEWYAEGLGLNAEGAEVFAEERRARLLCDLGVDLCGLGLKARVLPRS